MVVKGISGTAQGLPVSMTGKQTHTGCLDSEYTPKHPPPKNETKIAFPLLNRPRLLLIKPLSLRSRPQQPQYSIIFAIHAHVLPFVEPIRQVRLDQSWHHQDQPQPNPNTLYDATHTTDSPSPCPSMLPVLECWLCNSMSPRVSIYFGRKKGRPENSRANARGHQRDQTPEMRM